MPLQQDSLARRAACFGLLAAASSGPGQTYFIGLFGAFMRQDFALSDAALGVIYGIATLASGVLMFWLGALADRVALRRAISLAVFLVVAGCVLVAFAAGPLSLCVGLFLLRLGGQGLAGHFAIVAAARHSGIRRGRGVATATLGFLLGEALYPLLVIAALEVADWRTVWLLAALMLLIAFVPALRYLASRLPLPDPSTAPGHTEDDVDWNRRKLAVSAPFLSILGVVLVPGFVVTAVFFHQAPLAERLGWALPAVAQAFILYAVCQGIATLFVGRLVDRRSARTLVPVYLLPLAAGLLALLVAPPSIALWLTFAGLGAAAGSNSVIGGAIWIEVFGSRKLGLVRGMYAAIMVTMTAFSPVLLGILLSGGASLAAIFLPVIAYAVIAPILLAPLTHQRHEVRNAKPPS
ncbi:MAG: MFS transporter [Woeseia sp.]